MLPHEIHEHCRRLANADMDAREDQLPQQFSSLAGEFISHGHNLTSSSLALATGALLAAELRIRLSLCWAQVVRVLKTLKIEPSPTLPADIKQFLDVYLREHQLKLELFARDYLKVQASVELAIRELHRAVPAVWDKLAAETDFFVTAMSKSQPNSVAQPSIVVQGNVGALQTGAGAVANVTQHITNGDRDAVLGALSQVLAFLRRDTTSLPEERRNELVEVAEEAVQEVQKEHPNESKVLGAFSVLAMTIQALADAQPAYQALKGAAAVLGLVLP